MQPERSREGWGQQFCVDNWGGPTRCGDGLGPLWICFSLLLLQDKTTIQIKDEIVPLRLLVCFGL